MYPNFALLFLVNTHNEILLLRRINTPFCNQHYSLPGGQIERGETARETVIREAQHSLGITIMADDVTCIHIMYRKCNDPEFFACIFTPQAWTGIPLNQDTERYDDMHWFSIDQLPNNVVPAHLHAIKQIQQNNIYSEHGWNK